MSVDEQRRHFHIPDDLKYVKLSIEEEIDRLNTNLDGTKRPSLGTCDGGMCPRVWRDFSNGYFYGNWQNIDTSEEMPPSGLPLSMWRYAKDQAGARVGGNVGGNGHRSGGLGESEIVYKADSDMAGVSGSDGGEIEETRGGLEEDDKNYGGVNGEQ